MYNNRPVLLPNTWGDQGTSFADNLTPTEGELYDLISGPRSTQVRYGSTSSSLQLDYGGSNLYLSHIVVCRADLALRNSLGAAVGWQADYGAGHTSFGSGLLDSTDDLIGIDKFGLGYGQDVVIEHTGSSPVQTSAARIECYNDGVTACGHGLAKAYASNAFDFGVEPVTDPRPAWADIPETRDSYARYFKPLQGHVTYEIEAIITLEWQHISPSTFQNFTDVPQLLSWPLFVYDPGQVLWAHKLEHVIVQHYAWVQESPDHGNLQVTFGRLAHYE